MLKSSAIAAYKWRKEIIKSSCKRAQVLLVKNQSRDVLCTWLGGEVRGKKALLPCLKGGRGGWDFFIQLKVFWDFFIQIYRSFYGNYFCKPYMVGGKMRILRLDHVLGKTFSCSSELLT